MMQYVIVSKMGGDVVFVVSTHGNLDRIVWTPDLNKAMPFAYSEESNRNQWVIALWSGGIPAGTIAVNERREVVEIDKLNAWRVWEVPTPSYFDSDSGCKRMVICGPNI